ncbi:protein LONGIFOLIA 1 isoform X2 [Daucus carota subsp. sativus]|uniref:protein LONGIFOLIA 1 isoform X2 n=1 Tax=Daucus carota subsp. sativus TaxID=79200 RepID=UPI0007EF3B7F|nr:PREDICTED: protein LONGIFOLIA 1-like isoform X2 [Daucus carota subsp. sativus]
MSTKLLRSLTDEKADMQKQIGCMNGIFQLFGRANSHNHKRLPPGTCRSSEPEIEQNYTMQKSLKSVPTQFRKEKKLMTNVELSRTSCSSSCSSSTFSSVDYNKTSQSEPSSSCHSNLPEMTSVVSPPKQPNSSLQLSRQSVDLRDIVKESMYKQSPGLSVKTNTTEEKAYEAIKQKDSPRPQQQHKHVQAEVDRRDVSLQVLSKLRDGPWNANKERFSALPLVPRDSPRYSYDETESRRKLKSTTKLKELPRLSLDSRERSPRISSSECRKNQMPRKDEESRVHGQIITENQEPGSNKKPSAIVARLMGFEPIPDTAPTEGQAIEVKSCLLEESETISPSLKVLARSRQSTGSGSPKVHCNTSVSPRLKNDSVYMDSISGSMFSVKKAPRTQIDSNQGSRRQSMNCQETSTKLPLASSSVYSEIKKKLGELEFRNDGKDLRALKQIIEAMERKKESLDSKKNEEQNPNSESCTSQSSSNNSSNQAPAQRRRCNSPVSPVKGSTSPKNRGTQIVKARSAKLIENSVIPDDDKSCLQKIWSGENAENIKNFAERRTAREFSLRNNCRRDSSGPLPYIEEKKIDEPVNSLQHLKASQQTGRKNLANFRKSSPNLNPRMPQKKHGMEKLSGFATQSSDLKISRIQSSKLPTEPSSPTKRQCQNSAIQHKRDDQIRRSPTGPRNMNKGDSRGSMQTQNAFRLDVQIDRKSKSKSTYCTTEIISPYKPKDPNKGDAIAKYAGERLITELPAPLEQPSPISVLDITFYEDDNPSPVKKISTVFQGHIDCLQSSRASKFDQRTLNDVSHLVQELGLLNTSQDKAATDHHKSLTNPDHRYVAEILTSTGLLRDLGSSTTMTGIQINQAGLLVNPELYHVLEKDTEVALEQVDKKSVRSTGREKVQRRLVFDAVSEILLEGSFDLRTVQTKMGERRTSGEKLLEELCTKLDQQQATPDDSLNDIDDELKSILRADIMNKRKNWTGYSSQLAGLVLDIERMIFKDLIGEIVREG